MVPFLATTLALILPSGTDRWVGLLSEPPDEVAGTYVEIADGEYERIAHSVWTNVDLGDGRLARRNSGAIVFGNLANGAFTVTHWGIFDAAVGGNLLASGPVLNTDGVPQPATIPEGDGPRFNDGDLAVLSSEAP